MRSSKNQSVWSNLPDKLIKLSSSLKEYIESDQYLSDDDHLQFQLTSMEIKAIKNELHEGVAYIKFIDKEENRQILCQYLQLQLNQIDNLKRDFNIFLNKNNIQSFEYRQECFTPSSPYISPPQQQMILSNPSSPFQFDCKVNYKKNFIGSIRFFMSKLQYQKESYFELYSQKENVNNCLQNINLKHKNQLPQTTYQLERLCEIVRQSLQELRQQVLEVSIDDKNTMQMDQLNNIKKKYNKIKTIPLIQYFAKLYKVIKELKIASFKFSKAIAAFEKHLSDKKNLQNVQQLIEHIEQESDVRFRMRQQSDPTQELSPSKRINAGIPTCKTLSKCVNDNIYNSPNFELSNVQTDDQSSIQEDTSSLFQSQISTSYTERRIPHPMQNRIQDDDKENNKQNQNKIFDPIQKCHSAVIKTQNNLQYEKNVQTASEYNLPIKKTQSTQNNNNGTNKIIQEKSNGLKDNKNAMHNKNIQSKDIQKDTNNQTKQPSQENKQEIQASSQKKENRKSIIDEIRYKRQSKELGEAKDSVISNAQSSIIDPDTLTDRKYEFTASNKNEDDRCMSKCNIF